MTRLTKRHHQVRLTDLCLQIVLTVWAAGIVHAQDAPATKDLQVLPEKIAAQLAESWQNVEARRARIAELERRLEGAEGITAEVLERRLEESLVRLLKDVNQHGSSVADQADAGYDVSRFYDDATGALALQLDVADTATDRIRQRVTMPSTDLSAAEQAAADMKLFESAKMLDGIYETILSGLDVSGRFGLDDSEEIALLTADLAERLVNTSVFLQLMVDDVTALRASVAALPGDAELAAKLRIAQGRVSSTANVLERLVTMAKTVGLDTSEYREQILTATGAITTDIFDLQVIGKLLSRWGGDIADRIAKGGPTFLFRLALFFIIILVFRKIAQVAERLMRRGLAASKFELSQLLQRMIVSAGRNLVLLLGVLIALAQVGISLGPLLAGLGIAGFIVGFALQDSLSNFAAGMMILIYRPYDVGDFIEAGGISGKVSHMSLVNTTILTFDNQTIIAPNNKIWGDVIKNVTAQTVRRVDLVFGVSYSDDIAKAEQVLADVVASHDKILADPEPMIKLHELADSSVNFIVRPWVKTADYWDVYWDLTRTVKLRFDEEGISIPFPQRDVHLYAQEAT